MFCTHRFNFVFIAAFILILLNQSAFAADAEVDGGNIVTTPCSDKPDGYKYVHHGVVKVCNKGLIVVDLDNKGGNVFADNNGSATSTTGNGSGTGSSSGSGNGSGTSNSSGSGSGSGTGSSSGTGNDSGTGSSSGTGNGSGTSTTGNGSGPGSDSGTGNGSGSNQPNSPIPNTPTPSYNLPPEKLKKLNEGLASLARMYQQELKKLEDQKLSAKSSYESWVVDCYGQNQSYGAAAIKKCIDSSKKEFDDKIANLDKKMAEKVDMFNQAVKDLYAAYGVDIGKTPNISAPNVSGNTDTNADNPNTNTTTNNTTNNNTSNNSSNTTVNNNTTVVNNGGSSGSSGNGSSSNNNASGQSGSGNATGSQGDGKGDKGHCDAYPDTLGCSKLGSQADIDKQINSSAGKDGRFGIGESNVSINSFTKANIFLETGSCPSPKSFVVFKTRHEISYQPLCDAVQQFRPFVIVSAVLVSFLIVRQAIVSQL